MEKKNALKIIILFLLLRGNFVAFYIILSRDNASDDCKIIIRSQLRNPFVSLAAQFFSSASLSQFSGLLTRTEDYGSVMGEKIMP